MELMVMLAIWVVLGLIAGLLAGPIWKGNRPLGESADYAIAVAAAVLTGLVDWYVLPLIGLTGTIRFIAAVLEPPLVALLVLWIVRRAKTA